MSAVILAAGQSSRMGKLKQLMPLGQGTVLQRTIDNFLASHVDELIVVTGYESDAVTGSIKDRPVKLVFNPDYRRGMSTSIAAGIRIARDTACAFIIALGDQPFIDNRTINFLISRYVNSGKGIAIPIYQGKRGHPVIFDIKYKDKLMSLTGDTGAASLIAQNPGDVLEVEVSCEGIVMDIDTPEDYQEFNAG